MKIDRKNSSLFTFTSSWSFCPWLESECKLICKQIQNTETVHTLKNQTKQKNIPREHRLLPGILLLTYCLSFFSFCSGSVFSRVCIYLCMKLDFTLLSLYGLITSFTNTLSLLQKINEIPAFRWNVMLKWMVQKSIFRWLTPVWGRHDKCFMHINWRMMDLMIIP